MNPIAIVMQQHAETLKKDKKAAERLKSEIGADAFKRYMEKISADPKDEPTLPSEVSDRIKGWSKKDQEAIKRYMEKMRQQNESP